MSKSPEDDFVEAMRVFTVSKEYDDEFTDEMKTLLRTLAVAFVDEQCREHRALFSSGTPPLAKGRIANDHHACRTALLVDCGLEDTP